MKRNITVQLSPEYGEVFIGRSAYRIDGKREPGHCYSVDEISAASLGRLLRALPIGGEITEDPDIDGDCYYSYVAPEVERWAKLDDLYDVDYCARRSEYFSKLQHEAFEKHGYLPFMA